MNDLSTALNLLILLIGSNPLPNYVVGNYLLNPDRTDTNELPIPDTLIMIHSKGTKDFANNILNVLKISLPKESFLHVDSVGKKIPEITFYKNEADNTTKIKNLILIDIDDEERNSNMIINGVIYTILGLIKSGEKINSVHLNNTAGTKPMAVYSTLGLFLMEKKINPIFTDIHPNIYKLEKTIFVGNTINYDILKEDDFTEIINSLNLKVVETKFFPSESNKDLRNYVDPTIEEILKLHNIKKNKESGRFNKIDYRLFKNNALSKSNDQLNIRIWCNKIEEIERNNNGKSIIKYNPNKPNSPEYSLDLDNEFFNNNNTHITNIFTALKCLFDSNYNFLYPSTKVKVYFEDFIKSFMGEWLEEYITIVLTELETEKNQGHEIFTSFRGNTTKSIGNETKTLVETEIDVIVIKSFQLYIITCTTWDQIGAVKGKVFEALYRAEQLGGGNSKVISVSLLKNTPKNTNDTKESNIKNLKDNFLQFDADKNVRYIGLEDLQNEDELKKKLRNWIFDDNWDYGENKAK